MNKKIHIFGASGSGVSTFGKALSSFLQIPFYDSDDYYWKDTNPPYLEANPVEERKKLLINAVSITSSWVLSGTLVSWGEVIQDEFDLAVYFYAPREVRLERLKARELKKFGSRIEVGGDMYEGHLKFLAWAEQYDEGKLGGRSKAKHEAWIKTLKCSVLRIDGSISIEESILKVINFLKSEVEK
jgi:adenylate kinase family enzyme